MNFVVLVLGTIFGYALGQSGAADYGFTQRMFLLESAHLYFIIGSGVLITGPGLWLLKRRAKTLAGKPLVVKAKPAHRGNVVGSALFGAGWALDL